LFYVGQAWPTAQWLALQAENRLHYCINDLSGIITDLSKLPPVAQLWGFGEVSLSEHGPFRGKPVNEDFDLFRYLSIGECLEVVNIEQTRQYLVDAWRLAESRKKILLDRARQRQRAKE